LIENSLSKKPCLSHRSKQCNNINFIIHLLFSFIEQEVLFIIDYPLFRIMSPPKAEARENISDKIFARVRKTHSIDEIFQN